METDKVNEKLKKKIHWLTEDLKREVVRRKDAEFKYKDLKKTSLLFSKDVALVLHYKKYMELYEHLYNETQDLLQSHIHRYGHFYEEYEERIKAKFSTDEYSKED